MNDALDDGETHSGPLILVGGVKPLKNAKKLFDIAHVEPDAVVPDGEDDFMFLRLPFDCDGRVGPAPGELQCIRYQIDQHLPDHGSASKHRWKVAEPDGDLRPGFAFLQFLGDLLRNIPDRDDRKGFELLPADAGKGKEVIDELSHPLRVCAGDTQVPFALLGQPGRVILLQHSGEPVDRPDGRAQIVGDGIAERLQLLVSFLKPEGARPDPLFKFGIQLLRFEMQLFKLKFHFLALGDVAGDLRCANHGAPGILDRRYRCRNLYRRPVFPDSYRFERRDAFSAGNVVEDIPFLVREGRRNNQLDRLSDRFVRPVSEYSLRALVPARNDAAESLADNRVVRG